MENMEGPMFFKVGIDRRELKIFLKEVIKEVLNEREAKSDTQQVILNVAEAADFLRIAITTLYEKTSGKSIPHFKRGRKLLFYKKDLEDWLQEGRVKTTKELQHEAFNFTMRHESDKRGIN